MTMFDLSPITDRVDNNEDVHISFLVLSYAKGVVTDPESVHDNIAKFQRKIRQTVGTEAAYVWDIEAKRSGQAHVNFLAALTANEAYQLRLWWAKNASGFSGKYKLKDAAFLSVPTSFEERTISSRMLAQRALGYFVLIGSSQKAIKKRHQYKFDGAWLTNSGAMWGRSANIGRAETVQFEITNLKQRRAIDRYVSRQLCIKQKIVQWVSVDGELSDEFDVSPFSPDRIAGSKYGVTITPQMRVDIEYIIKALG
ncbi:hypothetical protein [Arthrobacter sp. SLBN-122]|uniref:hypothetical protein n=1 Tax=Arthrobacter sp. SLBN-122 TaxID=2768455 RepID=UPI00114FAD52|nr:hypothetical protein [Arthrobacter sp. SLBN-122]TQJ33041.1 hypothetical protein FBY36_0245 [Arthrobacter sp. SLBN-122]